jgi:thioredoxin reductase (NADPH)
MTIKTDVVIIGAGPCGLFQVFELGLLGIKAHIVDALPKPGGQCAELYPDKPIYDIPALPMCGGQELVNRLMAQIDPFGATFHLDQQVTEVQKREDGSFHVKTSAGTVLECRAVIVAGGVGSFQPQPLRIPDIDAFIDEQIFYRVKDPDQHRDKDLIVLGGGDSAFDWALELFDKAKSLTLMHRSENFRAAPVSVSRMRTLVADGRMNFMVGNATALDIEGAQIRNVSITTPNKTVVKLPIDHVLVFFGLSPKLGPIADWGLNLDRNQIMVDTERFESNVPGIYAIGDIASYPGKKKLILSGFHEAALAAFAIKARLEPDQKVHLQYTTTSPIMHERLGIKE